MDGILDACRQEGYNVTDDYLKVIASIESPLTTHIPRALSIVIMPFWNQAIAAKYGVPGKDGIMCDLNLYGKFLHQQRQGKKIYRVHLVNRQSYEAKVKEWLGICLGQWRRGWFYSKTPVTYETLQMFAFMESTFRDQDPTGLDVKSAIYDVETQHQMDCTADQTKLPGQVCAITQSTQYGRTMVYEEAYKMYQEALCIQTPNRQGLIILY